MRRRKQQSYLVTDESVLVEKFIPGGQALGQLSSGKKVFFWGVLPGEIVTEFQVTLEKTSYLEAIALKIDQPSAQRIAPRDDCYLATSPWQILKYDYELTEKHALLVEIFRQAGFKNLPEILPVQTDGQDFFYRNKMEYGLFFDHEDQKLYPSFNQRGTHRKIKITKSSLERPEIFQAATKNPRRPHRAPNRWSQIPINFITHQPIRPSFWWVARKKSSSSHFLKIWPTIYSVKLIPTHPTVFSKSTYQFTN